MACIAGLLLVAGQLLNADALEALGSSEDARNVPHLEKALDDSVVELHQLPATLPPPDLEDEIVAALVALERLDPHSALVRARYLTVTPVSARLSLAARRVAARAGDVAAVRAALGDYFDDPEASRLVLGDAAAASDDIRLRDFAVVAEPKVHPTNALFRTTLLRRLGDELEPPRPPPIVGLEGDALSIQVRVLALSPRDRYPMLRLLASADHVALVGIPIDAATIDRLYPYLARSRHRRLRERVRRSRSARGAALASLLLSPTADPTEKRAHADAMRDVWAGAVIAAGRDVVSPVVGEDFIPESVPFGVGAPWELAFARRGPDFLESDVRRRVASVGRRPDALAAMYRFHERYPRRFLAWLEDEALCERARFVMALSGDPARLPLLIELATAGEGSGREAAFRGLAEMELGSFDQRLHRLAGADERRVRFQTALALVPTGDEWAVRLLMAEIDETNPADRLRARRALERLPAGAASALVESLVSDGTATPLVLEVFLDSVAEHAVALTSERLWEILSPYVAEDDPTALLVAARLEHPEARAAVRRYLGRQ